jgi:Ig-like domain-containing protein
VTSSNALVNNSSTGPTILEQPGGVSVPAGVMATFSVTVTGASPLNYYWSFNNANIPGATNSTLTLTNVMLSQAGNYSVFISNAYGSTNSGSAALTIIKNLPELAIVSSSGTMSVSWPTNSPGFVLVTTTNLVFGNWVRVPASPFPSGNKYIESIGPSGSSAFYRLQFTGN